MPASRPRKAKPVEIRRTDRLWTVLDQSQATTATAIPTTRTCQNRSLAAAASRSEKRIRARRRSLGVGCRHSTKILFDRQRSPAAHVQMLHRIVNTCNICFMAEQPSKSSPLSELCSALPSLPMRLQEVGRFVAANDYDATTRSMRDLAADAGADPASFTRLAQGARLFRLGRIARGADRGAPAGASLAVLRPRREPAPRPRMPTSR